MKNIIICLCGSIRFIDQFAIKQWELEQLGYIVLGCPRLPDWYCPVSNRTETQDRVEKIHRRKIDIADEVLVLNVGGYIGESTRSEIEYAKQHGKVIHYLEDEKCAGKIKVKEQDAAREINGLQELARDLSQSNITKIGLHAKLVEYELRERACYRALGYEPPYNAALPYLLDQISVKRAEMRRVLQRVLNWATAESLCMECGKELMPEVKKVLEEQV